MAQLQFIEKPAPLSAAKFELDSLLRFSSGLPLLRLSLLLLGLLWVGYGLSYRILPPQIPFLFSKPWGEDQLIEKRLIVFLPLVITVLFAFHIRLTSVVLKRDKLLVMILLWTQVLISLLAVTTMTRVILLVG